MSNAAAAALMIRVMMTMIMIMMLGLRLRMAARRAGRTAADSESESDTGSLSDRTALHGDGGHRHRDTGHGLDRRPTGIKTVTGGGRPGPELPVTVPGPAGPGTVTGMVAQASSW